MSANAQPVLDPGDLNDTDEAILDIMHEGRVTPPYIAEELGKSREYASERLIRLKEHENAKRIAPGLYELVEDPRGNEGDIKANPPTKDVVDDYLWDHYGFGVEDLEDQLAERDELRAALADARHAYENVNGDEVEDALDRMEEILDGDD